MDRHEPRSITPPALRGPAIGIIVSGLFAALWANWSSPLLSRLPAPYGWVAVCVVVAASGTLLLAGVAMFLRARRPSLATGGGSASRGVRRGFLVVLAGEIVALNIAAFLLASHHALQYLPPAVAVVVGLHFLPLAKLFRAPHFFATAIVMTMAGVLAAIAVAGGSPATAADGLAELACAVALWGTGAFSWFRVHQALAGSRAAPAVA